MQNSCADQCTSVVRRALLKTLATKDIGSVKVVNSVLHAADPAELVIAFGADHVIAAAFLFLDNHATLWTVCHLILDILILKVLLHGHIQLRFTVLLHMVWKSTTHANLVIASSTLTIILIGASEARICLLFQLLLNSYTIH